MRRLKILTMLASMAIVAVGAGFLLATQSVWRTPAYYTSGIAWDSAGGGQPGGQVRTYVANDSLLVGDVVYFQAANRVAKSATLADYNSLAGVVVGGDRIASFGAAITASEIGTLVGIANQKVWVLRSGRTWMRADAADSVYAGEQVIPSNATAGRVEPRTTAIDSFHRVIGRAVTTVAASATLPVEISVK